MMLKPGVWHQSLPQSVPFREVADDGAADSCFCHRVDSYDKSPSRELSIDIAGRHFALQSIVSFSLMLICGISHSVGCNVHRHRSNSLVSMLLCD